MNTTSEQREAQYRRDDEAAAVIEWLARGLACVVIVALVVGVGHAVQTLVAWVLR